jgi:hypothetical protein
MVSLFRWLLVDNKTVAGIICNNCTQRSWVVTANQRDLSRLCRLKSRWRGASRKPAKLAFSPFVPTTVGFPSAPSWGFAPLVPACCLHANRRTGGKAACNPFDRKPETGRPAGLESNGHSHEVTEPASPAPLPTAAVQLGQDAGPYGSTNLLGNEGGFAPSSPVPGFRSNSSGRLVTVGFLIKKVLKLRLDQLVNMHQFLTK